MRLTYRHLFAVLAAVVAVYFGVRTSRAVVANEALAVQLQTAQRQVTNLQLQNAALQQQAAYEQTPAFVEKMAREQLGLMRPGDHVVQLQVSPPNTMAAAPAAPSPTAASTPSAPATVATARPAVTTTPRPASAAPMPPPASSPAQSAPNWQRWLQLFVSPPPEPAGLH